MTYLPDVNVWVAMAFGRHVHHAESKSWLQSVVHEQIAFCRITELGFLRLVTNTHVMGTDVLNPMQAWADYDAFRADPRIQFLPEPSGFGALWRKSGQQIQGGSSAWTDAYLAILAAHTGSTIVTFDRGFKPLDGCTIVTLPI